MKRILFICHGNICRSPMAQYVMQYLVDQKGLSDQFEIDSAATSCEEIGNEIHYGTRRKLEQMNIPFGNHRAIQITSKDVDYYDYIVAMDSANMHNLFRMFGQQSKFYKLLSFSNHSKDIADPWYTGNFDQTYQDIIQGCTDLLEYIIKKEIN